jgi:hypothetical protein
VAAALSRRQVLTGALLASASLLASSSSARTLFANIPWVPGTGPAPRGFDGARFFTDAERRCTDALVARLIPTDDTGPGALDAGVTDFIDNQLAGSYGRGERWYMKGPFADGLETQSRASSAIRSMAATATWSAGSSWASPAPATTTATISTTTAHADRHRAGRPHGRPAWNPD